MYDDNPFDYWRGRIWAPMNYLVYLAARQHSLAELCNDLARKSRDLFLIPASGPVLPFFGGAFFAIGYSVPCVEYYI